MNNDFVDFTIYALNGEVRRTKNVIAEHNIDIVDCNEYGNGFVAIIVRTTPYEFGVLSTELSKIRLSNIVAY